MATKRKTRLPSARELKAAYNAAGATVRMDMRAIVRAARKAGMESARGDCLGSDRAVKAMYKALDELEETTVSFGHRPEHLKATQVVNRIVRHTEQKVESRGCKIGEADPHVYDY